MHCFQKVLAYFPMVVSSLLKIIERLTIDIMKALSHNVHYNSNIYIMKALGHNVQCNINIYDGLFTLVKFVGKNVGNIIMQFGLPYLVLATLGKATQIKITLSVSYHPRWPRQPQKISLSQVFLSKNFANVNEL
jgi:hypothetical protein